MNIFGVAVLLFTMSAFAQTWVDVAADHSRIHYVGRVWPSGSQWNGGQCQVFSWSGNSASMSFEGTAIKAKISKSSTTWGTDSSWYKVFIDGKHLKDIAYKAYNDVSEISLAEGLSSGVHTVTLYKRTEASLGSEVFCGFSYNGTEAVPALKIPKRKLEFVGNSITCGYGVLDECIVNTTTWGLDNCRPFTATSEDHYMTYAAIAARALGAEDHTSCWSGRGVYRNNTGSGPTMPLQWNFASPVFQAADTNTAARWDYSRSIPDAVVIALGTNDFAPGVPAEADFVAAYVKFIKTIQSKYGQETPFILLHGPMMSDSYPAGQNAASTLERYLDKVITQTNPQTVHKLVLTPMKSLEFGVGSDWHPNVKQGELNATELVAKLRAVLSWDGIGDSIPSHLNAPRSIGRFPVAYRHGNLDVQIQIPGSYAFSILDVNGRQLYRQKLELSEGFHSIRIPAIDAGKNFHLIQFKGHGIQKSLWIE